MNFYTNFEGYPMGLSSIIANPLKRTLSIELIADRNQHFVQLPSSNPSFKFSANVLNFVSVFDSKFVILFRFGREEILMILFVWLSFD